jgi:hypothetical protein
MPDMVKALIAIQPEDEDLAARLAAAAYRVALQHGLRGPFIDVELDLWRELRAVITASGESEQCAK